MSRAPKKKPFERMVEQLQKVELFLEELPYDPDRDRAEMEVLVSSVSEALAAAQQLAEDEQENANYEDHTFDEEDYSWDDED